MWGLMLSDLNLLTACKAPPKPKDKEASGGTDNSDSKITRNPEPENSACPIHQEPTSNSPSKEESSLAPQEAKGKTSTEDEKSGDSKKAGSSGDSKPRQKKFSFEKSYKGRTSKGTFKAKVSAWGSMTTDTDKKSKSQSGSSSAMSVKEALFGSNPETTPPTSSNPNPNPNPSPKEKKMERRSDPPKEIDFYAGIPYDETLKKHIPQNYKDEAILILVPYLRALEKQLQSWTSWAQQKVVQALKRLGEDKAELTLLRQEKEEADKCARENEVVEETSRKRLHEMENALSLFNEQLQVLSSKIRRLEMEKALFLKEKEAEHLKASMEAAKMEQTEIREQEYFKKVQSLDSERRLLLEEQRDIKRKTAELEGVVDKAKARYDQFEVLWKHEAKQREKTTAQKDSLMEKRKEGIALRKEEEKNIKQMAERNVQKCEENIKSLEKKVSEMRSEADKLMIASLNIGYGSGPSALPKVKKRLAVFEGNFGSLTPERECVMCMNEEKSVVFLPCAHQIHGLKGFVWFDFQYFYDLEKQFRSRFYFLKIFSSLVNLKLSISNFFWKINKYNNSITLEKIIKSTRICLF
ncbi:hypothetical protein ACJIZ3_011705 [Penstemon smallii]|uniref:Uncharacterized protein n=1 Tax=Penstemon smallii TaxID=265156 RepID=A0ABD3UN42_9LAMI